MIALLADIHGNREAMTACLADAERRNAERYVFLGDLVGYGADPGWVTDRAMEYVARGAIAILGNHDAAAAGKPMTMNQTAMEAIDLDPRHARSRATQLPRKPADGGRGSRPALCPCQRR